MHEQGQNQRERDKEKSKKEVNKAVEGYSEKGANDEPRQNLTYVQNIKYTFCLDAILLLTFIR